MKLPTENTSNARNLSGDKQLDQAWSVVVSTRDGIAEAVIVRTWRGKARDGTSPVYASVWARGNGRNVAGHGRARGYGYCKTSAAIHIAFESAGITDFEPFNGHGMAMAESAMMQLCRALGFRGKARIVRHG